MEEEAIPSAIPAPEVTKIALRLRYLIESVVPCELEESLITKAHSRVITHAVVAAAKEAGKVGEGEDHSACVVGLITHFRICPDEKMEAC